MSRIFLLDDHHMVRDGLRSVLQAAGHDVVGDADAPDGVLDALVLLDAQVLLLDIHLQDSSGLSLLKQLQERQLAVRTVILTMSGQPHHVSEAFRLGAQGYVLKGSPSRELLCAIEAVSAGRRYVGDKVQGLFATGLKEHTSPLARLSTREVQILDWVVRGNTSAVIAAKLALSPKTVETYRSRLMTKLGVKDVASLVLLAIQWGLLEAQVLPAVETRSRPTL